MKKTWSGILILSFLSLGCGIEVQDKNKDQESPSPQILITENAGTFTADQLQVAVKGGAPQRYDLQFSWPAKSGQVAIMLQEKEVARTGAEKQHLILPGVASNNTYNFKIQHFSENGFLLQSFEYKVQTPFDLVISTMQLQTSKIYEAHRIFILENAVITTGSFTLSFIAQEIHADNVTIQSFLPGTKAAASSQVGRSGGAISLQAQAAFGKMNLLLNGESGGDGKDGIYILPNGPGCPGDPGGTGGDSAPLFVNIPHKEQFKMTYMSEPGLPGKNGVRSARRSPPPALCSAKAPDPAPGKPGNIGAVQIL